MDSELKTKKTTGKRFLSDVESHMPMLERGAIVVGVLALCFSLAFIDDVVMHKSTEEIGNEAAIVTRTTEEETDPFSNIVLEARAAYVYDAVSGTALYAKNESESLPLASVTKLMTALVAHELMGTKANVRIEANAISEEGESGLLEGETFKSQALIDFTLLSSSNDGARALAEAAGAYVGEGRGAGTFVEAMNLRAKELGLASLKFINPTGLDISLVSDGAEGSAKDAALLMQYLIETYPEVVEASSEQRAVVSTASADHVARNTNDRALRIPGLIASKTGYTDIAGGNLVIAFDAGLNRPVIIAILGSSESGRFSDVRALAKAAQLAVQGSQ